MQDDEGAILEKRNRRYQDAMERNEREKERKREERRQQTLREMQEARETQKAIKQQAKEVEAQIQKREFYRILRDNKEADARKAVIEEKKAMLRKQHQTELMQQIKEAVGICNIFLWLKARTSHAIQPPPLLSPNRRSRRGSRGRSNTRRDARSRLKMPSMPTSSTRSSLRRSGCSRRKEFRPSTTRTSRRCAFPRSEKKRGNNNSRLLAFLLALYFFFDRSASSAFFCFL